MSGHVVQLLIEARVRCSALALLVARVFTDHHDPAVAADHFALVTDLLDARVDLHYGRSSQNRLVDGVDW